MTTTPLSITRPAILCVAFAAAAGFFWWAFYERYYKHRDCIEAAASSCVAADGANLIGAGAAWSVLAGLLTCVSVFCLAVVLRRRRAHRG
ncbi:hypothetical protein [Variovorax sp. EBFNA2]|uniref:hypothetical protein n=1 Tax=Variovorax sp. EBFNA2 TaxID=3342097 RepID=UPI0029BFD3C2|nr:hypothetical protein [Variovorax boronicumulans]WPG39382.1 hypothetical protein RZE79_08590 [Variovorax boronicumulans]